MNIYQGITFNASETCDINVRERGSFTLGNRVSACGDWWTLNKNSIAGYNLKLSTVTGYTFCFILAKEASNGSSLDVNYGNTITATIVNANNP